MKYKARQFEIHQITIKYYGVMIAGFRLNMEFYSLNPGISFFC